MPEMWRRRQSQIYSVYVNGPRAREDAVIMFHIHSYLCKWTPAGHTHYGGCGAGIMKMSAENNGKNYRRLRLLELLRAKFPDIVVHLVVVSAICAAETELDRACCIV